MYDSFEQKYKPDEKGTVTLKKCIKDLRKKYHENMQPHLEALQVHFEFALSLYNKDLFMVKY